MEPGQFAHFRKPKHYSKLPWPVNTIDDDLDTFHENAFCTTHF